MLSRLRTRLSYANVMATIALFVALGGTGYAAAKIGSAQIKNNSVQSKDIKNNGVQGKDVKNGSLALGDFKAGQLPAGPAGPRGADGTAGSPAASAFTGRVDDYFIGQYAYPVGATPGGGLSLSAATTASPARTIVARDLYVKEDQVSINNLNNRTYSLTINGADSALSCSVTADAPNPTGTLACTNTTAAATVPPGSTLAIHSTMPNTSGGQSETVPVRFGWRATTP
jgi:hypothetical protein